MAELDMSDMDEAEVEYSDDGAMDINALHAELEGGLLDGDGALMSGEDFEQMDAEIRQTANSRGSLGGASLGDLDYSGGLDLDHEAHMLNDEVDPELASHSGLGSPRHSLTSEDERHMATAEPQHTTDTIDKEPRKPVMLVRETEDDADTGVLSDASEHVLGESNPEVMAADGPDGNAQHLQPVDDSPVAADRPEVQAPVEDTRQGNDDQYSSDGGYSDDDFVEEAVGDEAAVGDQHLPPGPQQTVYGIVQEPQEIHLPHPPQESDTTLGSALDNSLNIPEPAVDPEDEYHSPQGYIGEVFTLDRLSAPVSASSRKGAAHEPANVGLSSQLEQYATPARKTADPPGVAPTKMKKPSAKTILNPPTSAPPVAMDIDQLMANLEHSSAPPARANNAPKKTSAAVTQPQVDSTKSRANKAGPQRAQKGVGEKGNPVRMSTSAPRERPILPASAGSKGAGSTGSSPVRKRISEGDAKKMEKGWNKFGAATRTQKKESPQKAVVAGPTKEEVMQRKRWAADKARMQKERHQRDAARAKAAEAKAQRQKDARDVEIKERLSAKAEARRLQREAESERLRKPGHGGPKQKPLYLLLAEKAERAAAREEAEKRRKYEEELGTVRKQKTTSIIQSAKENHVEPKLSQRRGPQKSGLTKSPRSHLPDIGGATEAMGSKPHPSGFYGDHHHYTMGTDVHLPTIAESPPERSTNSGGRWSQKFSSSFHVDVSTSVTSSFMASLRESLSHPAPAFHDVLAFNITVGGPKRVKKPVDLLGDDVTLQQLAATLPREEEVAANHGGTETALPNIIDPSDTASSLVGKQPGTIEDSDLHRPPSHRSQASQPTLPSVDASVELSTASATIEAALEPIANGHGETLPAVLQPPSQEDLEPVNKLPTDHVLTGTTPERKATQPSALPPPHPASGRNRKQRNDDVHHNSSGLQKLRSLSSRRHSSSGDSSRALKRHESLQERRMSESGTEKLTGLAALRRLSSSRRRMSPGHAAADIKSSKPPTDSPAQRLQRRLSSRSTSRQSTPGAGAVKPSERSLTNQLNSDRSETPSETTVANQKHPVPEDTPAGDYPVTEAALGSSPARTSLEPAAQGAVAAPPTESQDHMATDVGGHRDTATPDLAGPTHGVRSERDSPSASHDLPRDDDVDAQGLEAPAEDHMSTGSTRHLSVYTEPGGGELNQSFLSGGPEGDNSVLLASPVGSRQQDCTTSLLDEAEESNLAIAEDHIAPEPEAPAAVDRQDPGRPASQHSETQQYDDSLLQSDKEHDQLDTGSVPSSKGGALSTPTDNDGYYGDSFEEDVVEHEEAALEHDAPLNQPPVQEDGSENPPLDDLPSGDDVRAPLAEDEHDDGLSQPAEASSAEAGRQSSAGGADSVFGKPVQAVAASEVDGASVASIAQEDIPSDDGDDYYDDDDFDEYSGGSNSRPDSRT